MIQLAVEELWPTSSQSSASDSGQSSSTASWIMPSVAPGLPGGALPGAGIAVDGGSGGVGLS